MDWARKPNPNLDGRWAKIKNPNEAISIGDLIINLKFLAEREDGLGWSFH
ncbi:MAG: hypothetical protein CM1200mP16_05890 [Nitrospina sp.]|nr:MAG: hypothetical protein CM1200mP16_05890 [Nitrospina sp.]